MYSTFNSPDGSRQFEVHNWSVKRGTFRRVGVTERKLDSKGETVETKTHPQRLFPIAQAADADASYAALVSAVREKGYIELSRASAGRRSTSGVGVTQDAMLAAIPSVKPKAEKKTA